MNEEIFVNAAPSSERTPAYKNRKITVILSVLLAALILLNAALALLLALDGKDGDTADAPDAFSYAEADIKDYIAAFSSALFTGKTFAGKEYAIEGVDDEYVTRTINSTVLSKAEVANSGFVNKTAPIGYADMVYFYILSVKEFDADGVTLKDIDDSFFVNAYTQRGELQIGAELLGKDFDAALTGKAPNDLGLSVFREHGFAADGGESVFVISYEGKIDGKDTVAKTANGVRLDTLKAKGVLEEKIAQKLADESVALGESFKLDITHDVDEDEKDELVHYTVTVNAAVTETPYTLEATLPDNYFGEKDDFYALNGKKLSFSIIVDYSVDYKVAYEGNDGSEKTVEGFETLTAEYIKNVLGFETIETDDAKAREAYFADTKKKVEESLDATRKQNATSIIWQGLLDEIKFDSLPTEELDKVADSAVSEFINLYYQNSYQYETFSVTYPTVEDYARAYFDYSREEFESYEDYLKNEYAPSTVKQQLLLYAIYNSGAIENAYEKYMKLLNEQADAIIKSAAEQNQTVTRDEALNNLYSQYGKDAVVQSFITQVVNDFLYEKNSVDWELSADSGN